MESHADLDESYQLLSAENLANAPSVIKIFHPLTINISENDAASFNSDESFEDQIQEPIPMKSDPFVNESYLEELGLISSRPTTPSIHSPSQNLRRISSSGTLAFVLHNQKQPLSTSIEDKHFIKSLFFEDIPPRTAEIVIPMGAVIDPDKSTISVLPDSILPVIMEYCSDSNLLQARLVSKRFQNSCDTYLKLVANLTLKIEEHARIDSDFYAKYTLSATMMPLYRNQVHIQNFIESLIKGPWAGTALVNLAEVPTFKALLIFSDVFITNTLIPNLKKVTQSKSQDPSPLFLLGEALLKSKRTALFDSALLPVLNEISINALEGILTPEEVLVSPGFMQFQENQIVLGATLHAAINFNLTFTVKHLIKLYPRGIKLRNHLGRNALLKIAENASKRYTNLPGPSADENIDEWMNELFNIFMQGRLIQQEFPENSRRLIEMFFEIVNLVSEISETVEEAVEFLGFNEIYTVYNVAQGIFRKHETSLLKELITARQYDILISIGFHFGLFIENRLEYNNLIHTATEINNPVIVAILLRFFSSLDVNQLTISGFTAVKVSTNRRLLSILRILLNDPRVDPNLHASTSPLIHSIEIGNNEATALLLTHPAIDIHHQITRNNKTRSPIERAVTKQKWTALELLLKCPNQRYDEDLTALKYLKEAEKTLTDLGPEFSELLQLVKGSILPTIVE